MVSERIHKIIIDYKNPYDFDKLIIGDKYRIPLSVSQYAFFLNYICKKYGDKKIKILDIGTYLGLFVDLVRKNFDNFDIIGIEDYEPFVFFAKSEGINVELCDVNHLNKKLDAESFDVVVAQNFFHKELTMLKFESKEKYHEYIDKILRNVNYVLKSDSIFLFNSEVYLDKKWFNDNNFDLVFSKKKTDAELYVCLRKR